MTFRLLLFLALGVPLFAAPTVTVTSPTPGNTVSALTTVSVTFSEAVAGVDANDLLINNEAAATVSGSGVGPYVFGFTQPPPGLVSVSWDFDHGISGLGTGAFAPVSGWTYTLSDILAPTIAKVKTSVAGQDQDALVPAPGATVGVLTEVQVTFSETVTGVDAADLLVGGVACTGLTGSEAGPYIFTCAQPPVGAVTLQWSAAHGIADTASNAFAGGSWNVTRAATAGTLVINEFLAANASIAPADENAEFSDWIEIFNPTGNPAVNLVGWSLSNDADTPNQWVFPSRTINGGAYLLVYASGKDRKPAAGNLHTNFTLNPEGGDLYLFAPNSPRGTAVSSFIGYPSQRYNYSYGPQTGGLIRYFSPPTPAGANGLSSLVSVTAKPTVSVGRGFFKDPISVILSCATPAATIRYTLDGSVPLASSTPYTAPLAISNTTILRAAAFGSTTVPSETVTHTYMYLDSVLGQNSPPYDNPAVAGDEGNPKLPTVSNVPVANGGVQFPVTWGASLGGTASLITNIPANSVPADYGMDPEVISDATKYDDTGAVNNATGKLNIDRIKQGLRDLPMLSIVLKNDDMFVLPGGLYPNSLQKGTSFEKPCSVELLLPDGTTGFATTCGLRIHGNASRDPAKNPKHGFKLNFKGSFGANSLAYALFPDSPVKEFDDIILRGDFNSSWLHWDSTGTGVPGGQRGRGTRLRDAFCKDTFRAMGRVAGHHRYVNLFINGIYWGTYDPTEQENNGFAAAYFGGKKDDYAVYEQSPTIKSGVDTVLPGDSQTPYTMLSTTLSSATTSAIYEQYKRYLDVPEFIDYMLLHFFLGHEDWGDDVNKNWYAFRNSKAGGTFKYLPWDMENLMWSETANRTGVGSPPTGIHPKLNANPQYRLDFADRVNKHMVQPDGALQPQANLARWAKWQSIIINAIACESARWGDYRRDVHPNTASGPLFTWNGAFIAEANRLKNTYFPARTPNVLSQFRTASLYPTLNAPEYHNNSDNVLVGSKRVDPGYQVKLIPPAVLPAGTTNSSTIYYTVDGADPRVYYDTTGSRTPTAVLYSGPITINTTTTIKARALNGTVWSALSEATFTVGPAQPSIRITELHYNPPAGQGGSSAEFIEIQNTGTSVVDLAGWSFEGIELIIPYGTTIGPGDRMVFASNNAPATFASQFPGVAVTAYFGGSLDNNGEQLALSDSTGSVVASVTYRNVLPWPTSPSGTGPSLEIINPDGDANSPYNWKASAAAKGTPGAANSTGTPSAVRINEFLANNTGGYTVGGVNPGYVELFNSGGSDADIGNWRLSTTEGSSILFPGGTSIPGNSYLLVHFTPAALAGFTVPANLGPQQGSVYLRNATGAVVDGVQYGPQAANLCFGRSGNAWILGTPTPGAANVSTPTAAQSTLRLNEWMANPAPGFPDWLELANPAAQPVVLTGMRVSTGSQTFRITAPAAVAAASYVQLFCNRGGTAGNNLDFNLPASGAPLSLIDSTGATVDAVTIPVATENATHGRFPNATGAVSPQPFPYPSPGLPNHLAITGGPLINEILVTNLNGDNAPWAARPGWLELRNPTAAPLPLGGWSLRIPTQPDTAWTFPTGATLPSLGYLAIWADPNQPASTTNGPHLNFNLGGATAPLGANGLELVNPSGEIVDRITWGKQIMDRSIGRLSNDSWALLASPTRGSVNQVGATLGPVSAIRINEWYAGASISEFDYVELYNTSPLPVSLGGLFLSDEPSEVGRRKYQFPPLTFIDGTKFVSLFADGTANANFTGFSLDLGGEYLRLAQSDNTQLVAQGFGLQSLGIAQGFSPEGGTIASFPGTPDAPNSNGPGPTITRHPISQVTRGGGNITLSITAVGASSYQWKRNGSDIPGATSPSLPLNPISIADDGVYVCVATGANGTTTSLPATVTVLFTYDLWADRYGLAGADRPGTADPDHDGLINYGEFLANTDPLTSASPAERVTAHPVAGVEYSGGTPNFLTLDARLNRRAAYSDLHGELTPDLLGTWTPSEPAATEVLGTDPNGDQRLRLKFSVPNGSTKQFLRLTLTP